MLRNDLMLTLSFDVAVSFKVDTGHFGCKGLNLPTVETKALAASGSSQTTFIVGHS